jgi:hypothetical protein
VWPSAAIDLSSAAQSSSLPPTAAAHTVRTWYLNSCDYLDPALAWTGVKHSGRGVSLSTLGFLAVTRPKSLHLRPAP